MLTLTADNSLTQLIDGVPVVGTVGNHIYDTYAFAMLGGATSLTVDLTVTAGDPDVYIGCDPNNLPNSTYSNVRRKGDIGGEGALID